MLAVAIRFNGVCCKIHAIHWILRRFKAKAVVLAAEAKSGANETTHFVFVCFFPAF